MRLSGHVVFGVILIAAGGLLLLDRMMVIDFGEILGRFWPLVLVALGLSILFRRSVPGVTHPPAAEAPGSPAFPDPGSLSVSSVFGDYRVAVGSHAFTGGAVSVTFGDIDIELQDARLAEGEHTLRLDGVFGDTTLRMPPGMPVTVHAGTTFGDITVNEQHKDGMSASLDYTSPEFSTAGSRLRVVISRVFGDVTVVGRRS